MKKYILLNVLDFNWLAFYSTKTFQDDKWAIHYYTPVQGHELSMEINDLFEQASPAGQLYVRLKELGITVERERWIDEEGTAYIVDLAMPVEDGWLPVTFGDRPGPARPALCRRRQARHLPAGDPGQAAGLVTRIAAKRAEILPHRRITYNQNSVDSITKS